MRMGSWAEWVRSWVRRGAGRDSGSLRRRPGQLRRTSFRELVEVLETRVLLVGDSFESNNTWQTATDLGVIPGVHRGGLSIDVAADEDWYRFELLRTDDVAFQIAFNSAAGNLSFDLVRVLDTTPTVVGSSTANTQGAGLTASGLAAGSYYLQVIGGGNTNTYSLAIDPATSSGTRVLYVNDTSTANDFYTTAVGNSSNTGLSPASPKGSIQQLLDAYTLGPNDLVLVDTGTYTGTVVATGNDEGITFAGSPGISRLNGTFEMADSDYNTLYLLTLGGTGTSLFIHETAVDVTSNTTLRRLRVLSSSTGIRISGGAGHLLADSVIEGSGSYGIDANPASLTLLRNTISGRSYGVLLSGSSGSLIEGNNIAATTYALYTSSVSNLSVVNNDLHHAQYGLMVWSGTVLVSGNRLYNNNSGAYSYVASTVFRGNSVYANTIGLAGYGIFGGADWSATQVNLISNNTTGIRTESTTSGQTVAFNRLTGNQVAIEPGSATAIRNNILVDNATGILAKGITNLGVLNNTIVTASGTGIRLQQSTSNATLRNNILSTTSGTGLSVATDSQRGFSSDYNNHSTSASATLVWWQKPFWDLFDWQIEADFDRHSIGTTSLAPTRDAPQFVSAATGDYRLLATSTSIDAGDPADPFSAEPGVNGRRINLGAHGNTVDATESAPRSLQLEYPEYYADWPAAEGRPILWRTHDVGTANGKLSGSVRLDLYRQGTGHVAQIAVVPAADGSYGWSPEMSGIVGSLGDRYWIQISSLDHPTLVDSSRELFSVPPNGTSYYVNDASTTDDAWATAVGNNRNTGKSPGDPKANLLPLLRSYDLGPADVVHIDTGNYIQVRNVLLSGNPDVGNDEGVTLMGPADPAKVARLDRANTSTGSTNIELNDADYVTLRNLSLVGAEVGLWVRNGSTNFRGERLVSSGNWSHGFVLDSDATGAVVDALTASGNGGDGIRIQTWVESVSNGLVQGNSGIGISLSTGSGTRVESNRVFGNRTGIQVSGGITVGNANLAAGLGNLVYDNTETGISAGSNTLVIGNTVWGHTSNSGAGIELSGNAIVRDNVVFTNKYGIFGNPSTSGEISRNRVYNNSQSGIRVSSSTAVSGNVVYSNVSGIAAGSNSYGRYSGLISNNLVYANSVVGVSLEGTGARLFNNTVYQPQGDAIVVSGNSNNITCATTVSGHRPVICCRWPATARWVSRATTTCCRPPERARLPCGREPPGPPSMPGTTRCSRMKTVSPRIPCL